MFLRSYEKRKNAAVEIQKRVRELCAEQQATLTRDGEDKIQNIIT